MKRPGLFQKAKAKANRIRPKPGKFQDRRENDVDTSRCGTGLCSVDTSRRRSGLCRGNTSRCSTELCSVGRHIQVKLRPQCVDMSECSTGLYSVDKSRSSTGLYNVSPGAALATGVYWKARLLLHRYRYRYCTASC